MSEATVYCVLQPHVDRNVLSLSLPALFAAFSQGSQAVQGERMRERERERERHYVRLTRESERERHSVKDRYSNMRPDPTASLPATQQADQMLESEMGV